MGQLILFYEDGQMEQVKAAGTIFDESTASLRVLYFTSSEIQPVFMHYLENDTLSFWQPVAYEYDASPALSGLVILKCVSVLLS